MGSYGTAFLLITINCKRAASFGPILAYRLSGPVYTRTTGLSLRVQQGGPHNSGDNG
jgi:hypothetical protein